MFFNDEIDAVLMGITKTLDCTWMGYRHIFYTEDLERAMRGYITPISIYAIRKTKNVQARQRTSGHFIFGHPSGQRASHPLLAMNFYRKEDAEFIVKLIEDRFPELKRLHIDVVFRKRRRDRQFPAVLYECEQLDADARAVIEERFV